MLILRYSALVQNAGNPFTSLDSNIPEGGSGLLENHQAASNSFGSGCASCAARGEEWQWSGTALMTLPLLLRPMSALRWAQAPTFPEKPVPRQNSGRP